MNLRPTLTDVAKLAGLSKTAVSLALRGERRIPEATKQRVREAARQLGYRPNPALSEFAAHRWRDRESVPLTIAYITTNHPLLSTTMDARAIIGVRSRAEQLGYTVEHFRFEDYGDPDYLGRVILNRGIRGIVLGQLNGDMWQRFPWHEFCAVACNAGFYRPPVDVLMADHALAVRQAWARAEERGYRRIGVALFDEPMAVDQYDKSSAALYCQHRVPVRQRIPLLYFKPEDRAAFCSWVDRYNPDVVLGFNDAVYWHLVHSGYDVPNEIAFACLMIEPNRPPAPLSGCAYEADCMGSAAVDHLDTLLRTNRWGIPHRQMISLIEQKWQEGETLPVRSAVADAPRKVGSRA